MYVSKILEHLYIHMFQDFAQEEDPSRATSWKHMYIEMFPRSWKYIYLYIHTCTFPRSWAHTYLHVSPKYWKHMHIHIYIYTQVYMRLETQLYLYIYVSKVLEPYIYNRFSSNVYPEACWDLVSLCLAPGPHARGAPRRYFRGQGF